LRRTRDDRVIGGVCGGLGRYLGVDPVLMRIAFVILAFAGGGGILVYLIAWVLIPAERPGEDLSDRDHPRWTSVSAAPVSRVPRSIESSRPAP